MATILVDTRQQAGKHEAKHAHLEASGHRLVRTKLHTGDYALPPTVSIDTKKDIAELAADVWQQHDRFIREIKAAAEDGTELQILVENVDGVDSLRSLAGWDESAAALRKRHGRVPISGAKLAKACATIESRYGCRFLFCSPSETGSMIERLLLGDEEGEEDGDGS